MSDRRKKIVTLALVMQMLGGSGASAASDASATYDLPSGHDSASRTTFRCTTTSGGTSATVFAPSTSSAESSASIPSTNLMSALAQIDALESRDPGWCEDGGGEAFDKAVIQRARQLLIGMVPGELPDTYVYPTPTGGLSIEWDHGEDTLRITLEPNRTVFTFLAEARERRARTQIDRPEELRAISKEYFDKLRGDG